MTSRERVLAAINHKEPDRVPNFLGGAGAASIHLLLYDKLKQLLGIHCDSHVLSKAMQYAKLDIKTLDCLSGDVFPIYAGGAPSMLGKDISQQSYIDGWGVLWQLDPSGLYYFPSYSDMPLKDVDIDGISRYPWPETTHPSRFKGLKEQFKKLRSETDFAISGSVGTCLCEQIYHMRGLENFMIDLMQNQEFVIVLLRKITDLMIAAIKNFLHEVKDYIDIFIMGDDMGSQDSLLLSPQIYRTLIKPFHAEIISSIKSNSRAKVFFHSCGNIYPLISDLIEIGVDILNPIQVSASDMGDTKRLKAEFGHALTFCGAIDTQNVLPFGTPDKVRAEVRQRIRDLAPGGGYLCAGVHCIQPDVPLENVLAMVDELKSSGIYPIG